MAKETGKLLVTHIRFNLMHVLTEVGFISRGKFCDLFLDKIWY